MLLPEYLGHPGDDGVGVLGSHDLVLPPRRRSGATPSSPSESSLSRHAARGGLSELPFDGMFRTAK